MHNPAIQNLSDRAIAILKEGMIYTYGRDLKHRPIIVMNLTLVDFDKYSVEEYYCAINACIQTVIDYMFVPGRIEKYLYVIDTWKQKTFIIKGWFTTEIRIYF